MSLREEKLGTVLDIDTEIWDIDRIK